MKKIILIGFAACYKSTVGKLLADKLNCECVDIDTEIEHANKLSIQQIFATHGETYFRKEESRLLRSLADKSNVVVSCGGGSVLSSDFALFAKDSVVVWLTATAQTVQSRLGAVARPLFDGLTAAQIDEYIQSRSLLYTKYAQAKIATDGKQSSEVSELVFAWLQRAASI